jgi:hypothetical protein
MKVLVAGGTGAVGRRLVPLLVASGHEVTAMTRSQEKGEALRAAGATRVVADGLDRAAVIQAVMRAQPEVVIHHMTGLTGAKSFKRFDDEFALTNRLRTEGVDYLLEAARAAGARRPIAQSFGNWNYERTGSRAKTEEDALDPNPPANQRKSLDAIRYLERAVTEAEGVEGVALRLGTLYGPGTASRSTATSSGSSASASYRSSATAPASDRSCTSTTRPQRSSPRWSMVGLASSTSRTTSPRRCPSGFLSWRRRSRRGRRGTYPSGSAGSRPARGRRGRHLDDDPDPRRLERQGQARARLDPALPELARRLSHRPRRPPPPRPRDGLEAPDRRPMTALDVGVHTLEAPPSRHVANADDKSWSAYGAQRAQPVATTRKCHVAETGSDKREPLPSVATSCRDPKMVRRGSTVRVRQRAYLKCLQSSTLLLSVR